MVKKLFRFGRLEPKLPRQVLEKVDEEPNNANCNPSLNIIPDISTSNDNRNEDLHPNETSSDLVLKKSLSSSLSEEKQTKWISPANFPIQVPKNSTEEEISSIKFLLDNFVDETDVHNICRMNMEMTEEVRRNRNFLKKCPNCHGRCKLCKFCQCREKEIFLVSNAIQKLNIYQKKSVEFKQEKEREARGDGRQTTTIRKTILLSKESVKTFRTLRNKLSNIKMFYPDVFECEIDIIRQWGQGTFLSKMNMDFLNSTGFPIHNFI